MTPRFPIAAGALGALLSVALGAFAAHGLKARLEPDLLAIFETGARYQMYHALALLLVGALWERVGPRAAARSSVLFLAGIVLFSGSLYALALSGIRPLGAVTPFGGVAFLAGWAVLAGAALRPARE
ncbi:MAG: DUF423 domain-containing protein [Candidatus Sumerlaeia bacterium]|nr:DUF423 domain-containing protein [Candidatus Sumerlaeia bacterium]